MIKSIGMRAFVLNDERCKEVSEEDFNISLKLLLFTVLDISINRWSKSQMPLYLRIRVLGLSRTLDERQEIIS